MNTTANHTKMQPETINSKKLSRSELRRRQKAAGKAERSEAKKKAKKPTQAQYDEALLQKAEEISKYLKAQTWRELETKGKFSKNDKLSFISDDMLIVGCDIGSETHYIRAIDTRGRELSNKALPFDNNEEGFQKAKEWAVNLAARYDKKQIVFGLEPTGHYWFVLATWLVKNGISVVQVNPYAVKQTKELEDNSQRKDDTKDPKLIANLVKDGNYGMPYLPEEIYAELRRLSMFREQISEDRIRNANRLHREIKIYFPEYKTVFTDIGSAFSLALLKEAPFPEDIVKLGADGVRNIWRAAKLRGRGYTKASDLVEAASKSVGLTEGASAGKMAVKWFAEKMEELSRKQAQVEAELEEKCRELPHTENILEVPGIGENILAGIVSEIGDISRFDDVKEIQKLSGLGLVACSSGKHKGETRISHRGRKRLRYWLYQGAKSVVAHTEEFKSIHTHYTTRQENPLKKMQSLMVIASKLLHVIYKILKTGVKYDPEKMLRDIKYPSEQTTKAA